MARHYRRRRRDRLYRSRFAAVQTHSRRTPPMRPAFHRLRAWWPAPESPSVNKALLPGVVRSSQTLAELQAAAAVRGPV